MFSYLYAAVMLIVWLLIVPMLLGLPFAGLGMEREKKFGTALVCGYMEMWALFHVVTVAFILTTSNFQHVVNVFTPMAIAGALVSLVWVIYRAKTHKIEKPVREARCLPWKLDNRQERADKTIEFCIWCIFVCIVIFQVVMSCIMAFADGDDAFYVPLSSQIEAGGWMYGNIPYTGWSTSLDTRHALAPFPIWISFLDRMSGIDTTIIAQSILGGVLLIVCYMIYYRIAKVLFARDKQGIPYFMLLISLLYVFGNYSFYTPETFLLTRGCQGKAVLGSLIIPFLLWCILQMGHEYSMDDRLAEQHRRPNTDSNKRKILLCILIVLTSMAAWLCSTLATFLCAAFIGISGVIIAIACHNQKAFWHAVACALPSGFYAVIFFLVQ